MQKGATGFLGPTVGVLDNKNSFSTLLNIHFSFRKILKISNMPLIQHLYDNTTTET